MGIVSMTVLEAEREQEAYVIDQRIGCDVVITGQSRQGQALTALSRGRRRARLFRRHREQHEYLEAREQAE